MRRGERFREKGREERDWEGNERERESLEGGRETEREMLGEGNKKGKERKRQEIRRDAETEERVERERDTERRYRINRQREMGTERQRRGERGGEREEQEGEIDFCSWTLPIKAVHRLYTNVRSLPDFHFISQTSMHV